MGRMAMQEAHEYYLKADLTSYMDEWVAILGNAIVAHGKNAKDVYQAAEKNYNAREILFVKVPGKTAMIL